MTCHYWEDHYVETENGEKELRPFCERTGKELPGYDAKANGCLGYSMSAEYREKYGDENQRTA